MTGASPNASLERVDLGRVAHVALVNRCPMCGETHKSAVFTRKKWKAWLRAFAQGVHVQSFWPELLPDEREEFFISGVCDACWRKTLPPEEEEDDDA